MANLMKREGGVGTPARSIFSDFFSDVDRIFDNDMFLMPMPWKRMDAGSVPAVNIKDNEKDYLIEVAAPGMKKEDFNVDMDEGTLTISSQKQEEKTEEKDNFKRREYNYSSFSRSFALPDNVKTEEIKAQYTDGVLRLTVPKREQQERPKKRIKID
ncbi:Hsp20/alpha crystallin family protein [Pontibacter sp. E15-1]|uniref:Hsp20/alpha crystallin family protein n=1 Tax=Pontibacter sp. E15-1 TaxID=2919918 RepID=UPI001F4F87D1|nr:Hsp20/alpha crystallin family protein [Pontibacter sp. E15-1]MCJ8163409.1 Hsp20/alpha crystallin family protein [Pontibacter sp. E15-1]